MEKATILVVEDEALIAADLQSRLQGMGYAVPYTAFNGEKAVDIAQKILPDLVLMDVKLQGQIDGVETARQIRSKRDIPIIYLSAYTDAMLSERAQDTEPFGYLSKPFSDYDLHNTIEMALYKHRAEKALRQEKKFAEKAISAQIDTFFVFDPVNGKAIRWNNKFSEITGYTDEEIADLKAPDSYYSPEDLEKAAAATEEIMSKGLGKVEMSLICKDGRKVSTEYVASTIKDDQNTVKYIISIGRDITERKKAEEELRESERKYRLLFENLTVGFALHEMIYDEKGHPADYRYLEINPAFEKLTGIKTSALLGKTVKEVLPNTEQYWIDVSGKVAQTGEPVSYQNYSGELGRYYDTWLFSPARDKFAVVFSDITERKKAEEELRNAKEEIEVWNRELEKRVKEKSDELEKSQAQLIQKEKLAAMGEMASGLAHELNSPLAGVLPMIEQYKNEAEAGSRRYKELSMMLKACEHMAKILRDFSSFSRESKGIFHSLDLNEVIEDTLSFYGSRIKQKSIQLIKEYDATLPEIVGDKTGLQQVTLNMFANAIDAMKEGGKLIIKTRITRDKNNVIMEFIDDGVGIDKKNLGKLFDPFYTTKRPRRGTGLGLSVSYKIIEKHKGKISVESEPGKGTKFTIYLPTVKQIKEQGKK